MMNMAIKMKNHPVNPPEKDYVSYPNFSLRGDKIPEELAKAEVGSTCRLEIIVKKVSDSMSSYDNEEQRVELEIRKLGYKGKKADEDAYKNMSDDEKDKADEEDVFEDESD